MSLADSSGGTPTQVLEDGDDREGVDPFARPDATRQTLVRLCSRSALVWGILYLAWRSGETLSGADVPAATALLGAEVLGLLMFAGMVRSASATPLARVDAVDAVVPDTIAVIDATGASVDELRTTLVCARRVEGLDRVLIVAPESGRSFEAVAERFGATIVEPDRTVMMSVQAAPSHWVLRLRAGDLPMPDLLTVCAGVCSAPDLGVVQLGFEEADPVSYDHDPVRRWSTDSFDRQVVRPSLDARGSMPWFGGEPVLVRPSALQSIDLSGGDPTDPALGVSMLGAGYRIGQVPHTLARVRGPRTPADSLRRRRARLKPQLRVVFSRAVTRLPIPELSSHYLLALPVMRAFQRLLLVVSALLTLGMAQLPLAASGVDLAVIAAPAYLLRWSAQLLLGRGRLGPFSMLRSDLRTLGADLGLPGLTRFHGLGPLITIVVLLHGAIVMGAMSFWQGRADRLPTGAAVVAFVIISVFVGVAMEVLFDALVGRQKRLHQRIGLGLVTCRLQEVEGRLVDLSTVGAGVVIACPVADAPESGSVTTVAFRILDAEGAWRNVSALVKIIHRAAESSTETRLGLEFDEPTDAPLDPVIEFLTIDRHLVALGRVREDAFG